MVVLRGRMIIPSRRAKEFSQCSWRIRLHGIAGIHKFCKCRAWNKREEAHQMVNELTVNEEIIAIYLTNGYKFYFSNLKTVILQELIFLCTSTKFNDRREGKEYIINIKKSVTTSGFIK